MLSFAMLPVDVRVSPVPFLEFRVPSPTVPDMLVDLGIRVVKLCGLSLLG